MYCLHLLLLSVLKNLGNFSFSLVCCICLLWGVNHPREDHWKFQLEASALAEGVAVPVPPGASPVGRRSPG